VVIGSDFKALGVVRSLGRRHIPCVVIDNLPRSAWSSRYVQQRFRWHGQMDDSDFLHFLLQIAQTHHLEQWILLPLPDETVELVARHTDELSSCYRLVTQSWEIVQWANDKRLAYQLARELAIPFPQTWYPTSQEELASLPITFPVIIKPTTSAHLQHALRLKALPASNQAELVAQYHLATTIVSPEHLTIQEIVPGDGHAQFSVAAYCKDGDVLALMTARRTRQYPIDYGLGSSFVEAIDVPDIKEPARRLLKRMGVSGMVEVEFKYDARTAQYKLLDVNLRPWGWHSLSQACGLDFPFIEYCDTLGELPPLPTEVHYGAYWIRLVIDLPAGLQEIRAGITTLGAYIRSLRGRRVNSVLDWRDPLPAIRDVGSVLVRSITGPIERRKQAHTRSQVHIQAQENAHVFQNAEALASPPATVLVAASSSAGQPASIATSMSSGSGSASGASDSSSISISQPIWQASRPVGAVIIGGDYQGLGIARSLGRKGIPVCVIDNEKSIARFSRYVTRSVHVKDLLDEVQTVEAVLEIGKRFHLEGWVLFPTREETVVAFSRYRQRLAEWYRVPTPELSVVSWAWDKRNTYRRAQELGIQTPRTWYPETVQDLEAIDGEPPFVVKPAIKEHFIYTTRVKAWKANSREELLERFQQAAALVAPGEVMIQELIPGGGQQQFSYCAFFKDGQALGSMVARRTRQHPPEFGRASTFVESLDIPELETLSTRFLKDIRYYGLVELEYKLDPRNGHYKLLDVNARTWGYHTLGQGAGVDFPWMLFADQMGASIVPCRARSGVKWVRLATDLPTALVEIRAKHLDWRTYLRSLKGTDVGAVFSWQDPLPGLVEVALLPYLAIKRGF
jgi:predicted ATP-grasp superfamily ATP-dependent carboligase